MLMLFSALGTSGGTEEPIYPRQKSSATKSTAIHIVTEANIKKKKRIWQALYFSPSRLNPKKIKEKESDSSFINFPRLRAMSIRNGLEKHFTNQTDKNFD